MPSDSVESFLDLARASRLLRPDQLDELARRSDVPHDSLAGLCEFLRVRGVLTRFQADAVRAGRGRTLSFAGYTLTDDLGPCPGGRAYAARNPALGAPVVLRRLRADAPAALVRRARESAPVAHPNLARLLDAGIEQGEPFVVLEPFDGVDLESLVRDNGPMPDFLACHFAAQAARGLAAAHAHGLVHGDVRPAHLFVGPLVRSASLTRPDGSPYVRPAPDAVVKVFELGLVPAPLAAPTPADDVFGLGATLHYLLTANPPSRAVVRPDLTAELVTLVAEMTAADPADRPTAADAADRLAALAGPAPAYPFGVPRGPDDTPLPAPPPGGWVVTPYDGPSGEDKYTISDPLAEPPGPDPVFAPPSDEAPPAPRSRSVADRKRLRTWFFVGLGFWLTAGLLWLVLLNQSGCFGEDRPPTEVRQRR